jgi:hypothetical protein
MNPMRRMGTPAELAGGSLAEVRASDLVCFNEAGMCIESG